MTDDSQSALYFYGVSLAGAPKPKHRLLGVDALGAVESSECAGLACWFSPVNRVEYADRLAANMENLDWLAAASVQHQRVVGALAGVTAILPARFGTVFLSDRNMAAHVEAQKAALLAALKRIEGASEWGVKVFAEAAPAPAPKPATSGTDYLRQKREQLQQRARPSRPAEVDAMHEDLKKASVTAMVVPPKTPQPGLLWQASFLVKRSREKAFHEVLRKYAAELPQVRIEASGPWPPYSFANPEQGESASNERKQPRRAAQARKPPPKPAARKRRSRS